MGELVKCKKCGNSTNADKKVCGSCGAPLEIRVCPECKTKIAAFHEFCPYCGHPISGAYVQAEPDDSFRKILFGFIVLICIAIAAGIYGLFLRPDPKPEEYNGPKLEIEQPEPPRAGVPYQFAKHFVRERLVAPKTAEFAPISQAHCVLQSDKKTWRITSFVDSQNRLGAMVRSKFTVTIRDEGGEWRLLELKVEEQ